MIRGKLGFLEGQLRLINRQLLRLQSALFFGKSLFRDVGIQLYDCLAGLHGVARPLQQVDDPAFGCGRESGKVFGHRFAAAEARDPFGQRTLGSRLHTNTDVRPLFLVVAVFCRGMPAAGDDRKQHKRDAPRKQGVRHRQVAFAAREHCSHVGCRCRVIASKSHIVHWLGPPGESQQPLNFTSPFQVQLLYGIP